MADMLVFGHIYLQNNRICSKGKGLSCRTNEDDPFLLSGPGPTSGYVSVRNPLPLVVDGSTHLGTVKMASGCC